MSSKKIDTVYSLIQVAETNLKNAQNLLLQMMQEKGQVVDTDAPIKTPGLISSEEKSAIDVQEGFFDGESMVGDNGKIYTVPQNYASKTQLIVGDRMKWILMPTGEKFKLIQPAPRQRVVGTFDIEGENYVALVDEFANPIKLLKASCTYAMKNLGLKIGDEVAIYIPKDTVPTFGAFISIVAPGSAESNKNKKVEVDEAVANNGLNDDLEVLRDLKITPDLGSDQDFF